MSRPPDVRWELTKLQFFDRPVVKNIRDRGRQLLSRFGSFVRRDVRTLLRRKGTRTTPHSRPGQPPFSGPDGLLRKWVLFAYDRSEQSVTIGPHKLNILFFRGDGRPAKGTVPEVLEKGGTIRILEVLVRVPRSSRPSRDGYDEMWVRADLRSRRRIAELPQRMRAVRIGARPYMAPAFDKNMPQLQRWKSAA